MRQNQKFKWTRTELQKFAEYDRMECEAMMYAESCIGAVTVGSKAYKQLEETGEELCVLGDELKALMGATRFEVLMNDKFTLGAWRGEVRARFITRHPWAAPDDCCPGWE